MAVLAPDDRYKDTPIIIGARGPQYAPFVTPPEFTEIALTQYTRHVLEHDDIGFLDRVAVRYYGQGTESMWWVIALINGIIDPERDTYPGMIVLIPPYQAVSQFLSRGAAHA